MYWLLLLSVFAASLNSIALNKAKVNKKNEIFVFNLLISLIWFIILFTVNGFKVNMNRDVIFWGVLYGVTQTMFILFKNLAMSTGNVSITTLVGNSSLVLSTIVSLIVWKESVTTFDIIGLIFLVVALLLCTYCKTDESSSSPAWKFYTLFFFICAAGVGIVFKAFGKSGNIDKCTDMMVVSSGVMIILYTVISIFVGGFNTENMSCGRKKFLVYALLSGVLSCVYNRLNVFLSGSLDAMIFFPSFNGGTILVSVMLSSLICREKNSGRQKIGLALGFLSILLIGIL